MMMLLIAAASVAVLLLACVLLRKRGVRGMPGLCQYPVVGCMPTLLAHVHHYHAFFLHQTEAFGFRPWALSAFGESAVLTVDHRDLEVILR